MVIYCISGLGADERLFEMLSFPAAFSIKHIKWIEPIANESMNAYAIRLAKQIKTKEDFILIGISLGGMMAVEMNKFLLPIKTIIISSVSTHKELSFLFNSINLFKLHRIIPTVLLKTPNAFADWIFGVKNEREKVLLRSFMKNVSRTYLKWAINAVLSWKNSFRPEDLVHIHGTADRVLPFSYTNATIKIKNGGHLMVHNRYQEISNILSPILNGLL